VALVLNGLEGPGAHLASVSLDSSELLHFRNLVDDLDALRIPGAPDGLDAFFVLGDHELLLAIEVSFLVPPELGAPLGLFLFGVRLLTEGHDHVLTVVRLEREALHSFFFRVIFHLYGELLPDIQFVTVPLETAIGLSTEVLIVATLNSDGGVAIFILTIFNLEFLPSSDLVPLFRLIGSRAEELLSFAAPE